MPPDVFAFSVLLPAHAGYGPPLRELIRQGMAYAGYPPPEAHPMADAVAAAGVDTLPADANGGMIGLRFRLESGTLVVELEGPHLPPSAPPAGPMDQVTVDTREGRTLYRFVRRLPAPAA